MAPLHLSEWLEWKCRSAAQSVGFMYSVTEILQSALMWVFISRKDICWMECWKVNLIVGWRWFMKSCNDWNWFVVPRKIMKMSFMNLFQKRVAQIKALKMISSWQPMKSLTYGGAALAPMAVLTSRRKCLSLNESFLFLRMVLNNKSIVWEFVVPRGQGVSMQFHVVQDRFYALFMWYIGVKWCNISSDKGGILRQGWEGFKELEQAFTVPDIRGEYFRKRLYEVGDINWKLIGGAITCLYYWLEWYIGFMDIEEAIEKWSNCGIWWDRWCLVSSSIRWVLRR